MTTLYGKSVCQMLSGGLGFLMLAAVSMLFLNAGLAAEQTAQASVDAMVKALQRPATRGIVPADTASGAILGRLRETRKARGLNLQERDQQYTATHQLPQLDLIVYFAYDSAEILPEALPTLNALGTALNRQELSGGMFEIGGHTDRRGTAGYNQSLSERRATAVGNYLLEHFHLAADRLGITGYGFEHLKNPSDPYAPENRRVQIVNVQ
jgi:outer membrane protein OmpA-like peptidoglycan-associated protein